MDPCRPSSGWSRAARSADLQVPGDADIPITYVAPTVQTGISTNLLRLTKLLSSCSNS